MASEEECGGDLFDNSLFEGMVLFSPSDLAPSILPPKNQPEPPSTSQDPHPPPPPPFPTSSNDSNALAQPKSQPLDEDLFCDLALQIPIDPPDLVTVVSATAPSRQISRKKKRALRIGYGREAFDAHAVVSVDDPRLIEDAGCTVSSDFTPLSAGRSEELRDRSVQEEVDASKTELDGDEGLSPSGSGIPESGDEVVPSTVNVSETDESFGSIEGKLNLLRSGIYAKLQRIREKAISVYAERKDLERGRRKAAQDVNQAETTYKDLEKELNEACEDEDFERAERVSESLATMEKEKEKLVDTLRETELNCDSLDSRLQDVLELHISAEEEGIRSLEQFAKDAVEQAGLIYRNAEERSSKELNEWQSSMELLEMNKFEIDIEAELISDSRSELDNSINDLVKADREEFEELLKKQVVLAKELEDLLKLVRLKETEIAENESRIEEVEKRMSEVASGFQEASSSVGLKHDSLMSAMSMIDAERERLSLKRSEIDKFISLEEQKSLALRGLASVALKEAKACEDLVGLRKDLASAILESREYKVQLAKEEEKVLEEIQILRQQISSARTALQELSSNRVGIQQDIDSFKQRIAFIDKRGPELESEKKAAAAARNFKEAGRIAAESKTLNSEKETLQSKMEKAALHLQKLEDDMKDNISQMQDNEEIVLRKEKEAAVASFRRQTLIATAARAERSAALEMGDSEESELLLKEMENAEERARELQEAYSLDPMDHGSKHFFPVALITKFSEHSLAEMAAFLKQSV